MKPNEVDPFTEVNMDKLPFCFKYTRLLNVASFKFGLTMNECRDKFGLFTNRQWKELLK
jgi:hypothetical protein